jgi:hypothetical protein
MGFITELVKLRVLHKHIVILDQRILIGGILVIQ